MRLRLLDPRTNVGLDLDGIGLVATGGTIELCGSGVEIQGTVVVSRAQDT
jgi:hypothetical protein